MKLKHYIEKYWIFFIIITQPILDIIAYFSFDSNITIISFVTRSIYLLFIVLYTFIKSKNKKKYILLELPFALFSILHLLNSYRTGGLSLFDDLRYIVNVMQFPVLTISLIDYLKYNKNQNKMIENALVIAYTIIFASVIISVLTNSYNKTYTDYGLTGWFSSANTQSMILTVLSPLFLYYTSKKSDVIYTISSIMVFILLYFNGTRACYYTLVLSFPVVLYTLSVNSKRNFYKIVITCLILLSSACLYNNSSASTRENDVEENTNSYTEAQKLLEKEDLTKEEVITILKTSYLYEDMINDLGEDIVYNEMKDNLSLSNLTDNRLVKRIYGKVIFRNSDTLTKLVGINHNEISKYGKDLENDFTAIFYYYGYLGFLIYILFILYFAYTGIKILILKPIKFVSPKFIVYTFTILLALYGSEFSGALLRKNNANIYLSILFSIYYIYLVCSWNNENIKVNVKKNKVSFLLLHLGYGGIESSTINTANALCDKYEIELVSFYKLNKNQVNKIDNRITIKYLYNGSPNKEEFLSCLHKKRIFSILKEGLKAVSILAKKKYLVIKYIINSDSMYIISTRYEFSRLLSKYGNNYSVKIAQEHHYHNNDKKYLSILRDKYSNIDYLMALTKTLESDYKELLKDNKHTKIVLMPNMLYDIPSKKSKLDTNNIITVSRLDSGKKNDDIIRIVSKLKDKTIKLYIIGDGKEYNNLKDLINELHLEDRVILTGYKSKEEIEEYMLKSSLFLMASLTEGLPMVLLEAMSYGLPCIAYETASGVSDIIKNDYNGYVIKSRNEEEYIKKVNEVMNNKKLREKLGKNTEDTIKKFSKDEILKKWYKILK